MIYSDRGSVSVIWWNYMNNNLWLYRNKCGFQILPLSESLLSFGKNARLP